MPLEIVVVTGRNAKTQSRSGKVAAPDRHRAHVLGFTTEIDELMAVADVVVSKPGGLTTSEVLARGAAMAIINPIPGQESRNSDFLLENGAAIKLNNLSTVPYKLTALLQRAEAASDHKVKRPPPWPAACSIRCRSPRPGTRTSWSELEANHRFR